MPLVLSGTDGVSGVDGTASNPAIEGTDSNTGVFFPAADTVAIGTGGTERLRVDSAGNVGEGVTPAAWASGIKALQVGANSYASTVDLNNGVTVWGSNYYNDGGNKFSNASSRYALQILQDTTNGAQSWRVSNAAGTAGNAITFTQAMTLDASGWLGLGETSPTAPLHIKSATNNIMKLQSSDNVTGNIYFSFLNSSGTQKGYIGYGSSADDSLQIQNEANSYINFGTNGSERARITSGGYFKASDNGTYYGSGQTYHEFRNSANSIGVNVTTPNASYANEVIRTLVTRAQTSAYQFFMAYSNDGSDLEFNLRGDGNGYADGTWNNNGADYAEFFESATGAALTLGATVVLEGNKVREATDQDPVSAIMGVVRPKEPSKASMVVGNTAWNKWVNKYLTDDFDRYIMEDHDVLEWTDQEGRLQTYESHNIPADVTVPDDAVVKTHDERGNKFQHYKLNPAWNPDAEYVNRENRPEWIIVGLVGQVKVLKGQPVNDRWIKMRDVSATVEEWMIR